MQRWTWAVGAGIVTLAAGTAYGVARSRRRRVSVWWDVKGPPTIRYLDRHLKNLATLGVDGLVIMLSDLDGSWSWSTDELRAFTDALHARRIPFGVDVWVKPTTAFVKMLPGLFESVANVGAQFIEFDTERPGGWDRTKDEDPDWSSSKVVGFSSLEAAAENIAVTMVNSPVPWGTTTHPGMLATTARLLGQHGDFVVPQAYSRVKTDEPQGARPGSYQERIYEQTHRTYGNMPIVMGLAAYDQEFPGWSPSQAMVTAADASFDLGVREVRFWSWKWIGGYNGVPKNRYAYDAVSRLR